MEVVNKVVSPLEWKSSFSKVLSTENYFFFYLVIGVLLNSISLIYLTVNDLTCRSQDPGIAEQFEAGVKEVRDLNHYVDVICTTEIKTQHWFAYAINIIVIILFFAYGILLKTRLRHIKKSYYLLNRKSHSDFDEMVITKREINVKALRKSIVRQLRLYIVYKLVVTSILLVCIVLLLVGRYTIKEARDLFLPFENECGPHTFWDEIRGHHCNIGKYYCHFEAEFTVYLLVMVVDAYLVLLIIVMIWQTIHIFKIVLKSRAKRKRNTKGVTEGLTKQTRGNDDHDITYNNFNPRWNNIINLNVDSSNPVLDKNFHPISHYTD